MDTHTEQLWRDGAPPFDGLTLWTPPLPAAGLCEALEVIVGVLESYVEQRALQTAEDWHEHDGYISMAYEATWDQLTGALSSEAALRRSSPGDDLVRRAWRDQNDIFYLRWVVYAERRSRPGRSGRATARRTSPQRGRSSMPRPGSSPRSGSTSRSARRASSSPSAGPG